MLYFSPSVLLFRTIATGFSFSGSDPGKAIASAGDWVFNHYCMPNEQLMDEEGTERKGCEQSDERAMNLLNSLQQSCNTSV